MPSTKLHRRMMYVQFQRPRTVAFSFFSCFFLWIPLFRIAVQMHTLACAAITFIFPFPFQLVVLFFVTTVNFFFSCSFCLKNSSNVSNERWTKCNKNSCTSRGELNLFSNRMLRATYFIRLCSEKMWLNRMAKIFCFSNPFASPWRIQNRKLYTRHSHSKTILIQKYNLFWFWLNETNKGPEKGGKNPLNSPLSSAECVPRIQRTAYTIVLPYFSLRNRLNGSDEMPKEFNVVHRNLWSNRRTEWKDAHGVLVLNAIIERTMKISFFRIVFFFFLPRVRFKEDSKYKRNDSRRKNSWSTTARTLRTRAIQMEWRKRVK